MKHFVSSLRSETAETIERDITGRFREATEIGASMSWRRPVLRPLDDLSGRRACRLQNLSARKKLAAGFAFVKSQEGRPHEQPCFRKSFAQGCTRRRADCPGTRKARH